MVDGTLRSADERLLAAFRDEGPDYVPVVATRRGLPIGYAHDRIAVLVDRELVERVTDEAIYRLTDRGRRYLAREATAGAADGTPTADD